MPLKSSLRLALDDTVRLGKALVGLAAGEIRAALRLKSDQPLIRESRFGFGDHSTIPTLEEFQARGQRPMGDPHELWSRMQQQQTLAARLSASRSIPETAPSTDPGSIAPPEAAEPGPSEIRSTPSRRSTAPPEL